MEENVVEKLVELIKEKKMNKLHQLLEDINSADFSEIFEELNEEDIVIIYRLLSKEKAAEVFVELDPDVQEKLINVFTDKELKSVIDELFMDDTVDLIEEMPSDVVDRILKNINKEDRSTINELLKYSKDTAGSIMTTEFVDLKENMTVEQAMRRIKEIGLEKETIYYCYVLTNDEKLVGTIGLKKIVISPKDAILKDIMKTNVIKVSTTDDKEDVVKTLKKYNLLVIPVVDNENKLVGIVTVDDAMDVMQDEATEDIEKMAAIKPNEDSYFDTGVFKHAKNRIGWLLILMLSAILSGQIITNYENAFVVLPLLVSFIPIIMDTGGNCGSQSSTLIIRGLATDEIKLKDIFKVIWKEFRISIIVGLILALVIGTFIILKYNDIMLSLTLGITLVLTVMMSKLIGGILPLLAKRLKLDPALMASPLITTIVDICSISIYFNVAMQLMF